MTAGDPEKISWYLIPGYKIEKFLSRSYYKLGRSVTDWPKLTLLVCIVVVGSLLGGLSMQNLQTETAKVWVPQNSEARRNYDYVIDTYAPGFRRQQVIITGKSSGETILKEDILQAALQVHNEILALTATFQNQQFTFNDICARPFPEAPFCFYTGILDFWSWNSTLLDQETDFVARINDPSATSITGAGLNAKFLLGGIEFSESGSILGATGLRLSYFVDTKNSDQIKSKSETWETSFIDYFSSFESDVINLYGIADKSIDEELGKAIGGDIPLVAAAYAMMTIYVTITLGSWDKKLVQTKVMLGVGGILLVVMATYGAFGLLAYIGFMTIAPNQVIPFMMIGIGVDNMFVVVNCIEQMPRELPIKERISQGLAMAGASITITSLTDVFAFGIGATSRLPAIRSFCIHAAAAVLLDFILQVTAFVALVYFDFLRRKDNRVDIAPCIRRNLTEEDNQFAEEKSDGFITKFMRNYYGPILTKPLVKVAVIFGFAGLLSFGIWGVTGVKQSFDLRDLAADGSYLIDFLTISTKFDQVGPTVDFYFKKEDYTNPSVQDTILEIQSESFNKIEFAEPNSLSSWLTGFLDWTQNAPNVTLNNGRPEPSDFYPLLYTYLDTSGRRFQSHIRFDEDGKIFASRVAIRYNHLEDASVQVDCLKATRRFEKEYNSRIDFFAFTFEFIFWEQFAIIVTEAVSNFLLASLGVFIITLFFLIHPGSAFIVVAMVAMIDVNLLGFLRFWDVDIDSVSVTNLVLSIGLAVDYSCHIAHSFMVTSGTRDERIRKALVQIGPSVVSGALTTFLGTLPLIFSNSVIFRTFFKGFFGTVIFGISHGIILLPVVLSLIGPKTLDVSHLYTSSPKEKELELKGSNQVHEF